MDVQNRHADTQPGTQPADTLSDVRLPTSVVDLWVPDVWKKWRDQHTTVFKYTKNIPRRENFPAWQRQQQRYHTFASLSRGRGRVHDDFLRHPLTTVTFPKDGRFERPDTVIIGGGSPKNAARGMETCSHLHHFLGMTLPTGFLGDT
jgi:hypothetical protein